MGNTSSAISRRHEDVPGSSRSQRYTGNSNTEHGSSQAASAIDQCDVISTDYSTSPQRKRSRFSSLRNPFRTKESRTQQSTRPDCEDFGTTQGRRNRGPTTTRRRRTRSVFETDCQGATTTSDRIAHTPAQSNGMIQATVPIVVEADGGNQSQSATFAELAPPIRADDHIEHGLNENPPPVMGLQETEQISSTDAGASGVSASESRQRTSSAVTSLVNSANASRITLPHDDVTNSVIPQRRRHNAIDNNEPQSAQRQGAGESVPASRPVSRRSNSSVDGQSRTGDVVSPMPGEDQAGMLSRLLSVAAAATAASLVGHDNRQALRDAREVAIGGSTAATSDVQGPQSTPEVGASASSTTDEFDEGSTTVDGSFDGFLAALQSGRLAQALRNGGNVMGGGTNEVGPQQPLNFFRMFRFSNSVSIQGSPPNADANGRMIPIIIVGIRSVPTRDENAAAPAGLPPFFDALGSLDALRNSAPALDNISQTNAVSTESDDSAQTLGTASNNQEDSSTSTVPETVSAIPFSHTTDSSSSVNRTEALQRPQLASRDSASSRLSARETRRGTRPMSGIMDSVMDHLRSFWSDSTDAQTPTTDSTRRRRRRPTWRPFSSNDGREAEEEEADSSLGATRSWIIYVLGGTYPENHPILTTPSLFTDSPTYEDMLLLSNLIGPAKPETASAADIDSAGTTYTLSVDNPQIIERCQICLADYEVEDTCRRLTKCSHYFHRECIDEWLTTGRNNCPLCRTETAARTQEIAGGESTSPEVPEVPMQAEPMVPAIEEQ